MAKRVRDILVDVGSGDLLFSQQNGKSISYYDVIWGTLLSGDNANTLYANVYIPPHRVSQLTPDDDGRFKLYFHTDYYPYDKAFTIRLVTKNGNNYIPVSQASCQFPVTANASFPGEGFEAIKASELLGLNVDGQYVANMTFVDGGPNVAFIYSGGNMDFNIGVSDNQSAQFLSLCGIGKHYRYPTSGVDVTKYINSVVGQTDLSKRITEEFEKDNIDAQSISFDSSTGALDVNFKHEENTGEPTVLINTKNLDLDLVDVTDYMLAEVAGEVDFEQLDTDYEHIVIDDKDIPDAKLKSCFANGIWIGEYFWTGDYYWKGEE